MNDVFNIDLPFGGNLKILLPDLENCLKKLTVRTFYVTANNQIKSGRTHTMKVPLWDPILLEDYLYTFLYPAFKWLQLFNKEMLLELV
jgi:hypothetical protein